MKLQPLEALAGLRALYVASIVGHNIVVVSFPTHSGTCCVDWGHHVFSFPIATEAAIE